MTPRAALTKHLLDGDDSIFTGKFDGTPTGPILGEAAVSARPVGGRAGRRSRTRSHAAERVDVGTGRHHIGVDPFDPDAT